MQIFQFKCTKRRNDPMQRASVAAARRKAVQSGPYFARAEATRLSPCCTSWMLSCFSERPCSLNRERLWQRPEETLCVPRRRLRITQHAARLYNSDRQQTNPAFIRCRVTDSCSDWPADISSCGHQTPGGALMLHCFYCKQEACCCCF